MDKNRKRKILEKVDAEGYVTVGAMSRSLGCAEATLRRDLIELDKSGLLKRVHGGAIKIGSNFVHNSVKEALYQRLHEKMEIAGIAYEQIEDGETIIIDDASTCLHLSTMIANNPRKQMTVITNSVLAAEKLLEGKHVQLILIGGPVAKNLACTEGDAACHQLRRLRADRAFIGVNGIDFEIGITLTGYPQRRVKQMMIGISETSYILADSSKFGRSFLSKLCEAEDPTAIVTDQNLAAQWKKLAEERGVNLLQKSSQTNKNQAK